MATSTTPRKRSDYRIGYICAIDPELDAARAALDEEHPRLPNPRGDNNNYIYGRIGPHNVVIASLPSGSYGTNAAAIAATEMRRSFFHLEFGLMVGVGGGVPDNYDQDSSTLIDIRLGDVVTSSPEGVLPGVIQYDLGKTKQGETWPIRSGSLNKPPRILLNAVKTLKSRYRSNPKKHSNQMDAVLNNIHPTLRQKFSYQGSENDVLFQPNYRHEDSRVTCLECDKSKVIERSQRDENDPQIHYGTIASGNQVVKDSVTRDYWKTKESVLCFEMEAAGLMDDFKCLVIRGVCDYADSHKNKRWQEYAALSAAAYAKDLLLEIVPHEVLKSENDATSKPIQVQGTGNKHWRIPRTSNPYFTGRQDVLYRLAEAFCKDGGGTSGTKQKRYIITGLGGMGKSEICIRFAELYREQFWGIFWVNLGQLEDNARETTERQTIVPTPTAALDFLAISKLCNADAKDFDSIKDWLANLTHDWLLILDNADDPSVDYSRYFPSGTRGNIILTSRNPKCTDFQTVGWEDLGNLELEPAVDVLFSSSGTPENQRNEFWMSAKGIVDILGSHTLALVQAGAFIKERICRLDEYAEVFKQRKDTLLRYHAKHMQSDYGSVFATLEVSANYLSRMDGQKATDALDLLNMLAFMDFSSFSEDILQKAHDLMISDDKRATSQLHDSFHVPGTSETAENSLSDKERKWRFSERHSVNPKNLSTNSDQRCPSDEESDMSISNWDFKECWLPTPDVRKYLPGLLASHRDLSFDNFRWRQACNLLSSLSIVKIEASEAKIDNAGYSISLHPLTHEWLLHRQSQEQSTESWSRACSILALSTALHPTYGPFTRAIHPHILACLFPGFVRLVCELDSLSIKRNLHILGIVLYNLSDFRSAELPIQAILSAREVQSCDDGDTYMDVECMLALCLLQLNQADKAERILEKVWNIRKALSSDRYRLIGVKWALCNAYMGLCQYEKARDMLEAEEVVKRKQPVASAELNITSMQHILAIAYLGLGQTQRSKELSEHVLEVYEYCFEPTHPKVTNILILLSRACHSLGEHEKSQYMCQRVLDLDTQLLSPTNDNRLAAQYYMAQFRYDLGAYDTAYDILMEALPITRQTLSAASPIRQAVEWLAGKLEKIRADQEIFSTSEVATGDKEA